MKEPGEKENNSRIYGKVNYPILKNWFWEEVPFIEGCKTSYIVLFDAIIDSVNRNLWRPNTRIAIDTIINKCKIDKRTYLAGRKWLEDHQLIEFTPGKNNYHMASFSLGSAVLKCTTEHPSEYTGEAPTDPPHLYKPKTDKPNKPKTIIDELFEKFYEVYAKYNNTGKESSFKVWKKLTDDEKVKAIEHSPKYLEAEQSNQDGNFIKTPKNYLADKHFNCQIKTYGNKTNHSQQLKPQEDGKVTGF